MKVEELVEWVAKIIYGEENHFDDLDTLDWYKEKYRTKAKQILSHPDLALIDRENTLFENEYSIIPLAEAIKEMK